MTRYCVPSGVEAGVLDDRPVLSTPQRGRVAIDARLLSLWQLAGGSTLAQVLARCSEASQEEPAIRAALACLAEAGVLVRDPKVSGSAAAQALTSGPLVSVVIVSHANRDWLEQSLPSLLAQSYRPLEIVIVENGPPENLAAWLASHFADAVFSRLAQGSSLARAINHGVCLSHGSYHLVLNPDVILEPDAIGHMVSVAQSDPSCAAVAPKLRFSWAPAFLNGLGNRVEPFSWGTDNAIGHLDLGQFDDWRELPSACYAAALIPRWAWEAVGAVDEGFPLYYEDTEWCYRARALGYRVLAAPRAVVYHAFGSQAAPPQSGLGPRKLRHVAYGRLRLATKLLGRSTRATFLRNYVREDWSNARHAVRERNWSAVRAYAGAWLCFGRHLPSLWRERRRLEAVRARTDNELFSVQLGMPTGLIWRGLPELTWDIVSREYLPLFRSSRTRPVPELE